MSMFVAEREPKQNRKKEKIFCARIRLFHKYLKTQNSQTQFAWNIFNLSRRGKKDEEAQEHEAKTKYE